MSEEKEPFLKRWSRLKQETKEEQAVTPAPAAPPVSRPEDAPPELPPLDQLTLESDYRAFFHPKVDEDVRRAALKRLFSDPHFNVMDGLDVYIDDYSKPDPLPAAMLGGLRQAQKILDWARDKSGEPGETRAAVSEADAPALEAESPAAPESAPLSSPQAASADAARPPARTDESDTKA